MIFLPKWITLITSVISFLPRPLVFAESLQFYSPLIYGAKKILFSIQIHRLWKSLLIDFHKNMFKHRSKWYRSLPIWWLPPTNSVCLDNSILLNLTRIQNCIELNHWDTFRHDFGHKNHRGTAQSPPEELSTTGGTRRVVLWPWSPILFKNQCWKLNWRI